MDPPENGCFVSFLAGCSAMSKWTNEQRKEQFSCSPKRTEQFPVAKWSRCWDIFSCEVIQSTRLLPSGIITESADVCLVGWCWWLSRDTPFSVCLLQMPPSLSHRGSYTKHTVHHQPLDWTGHNKWYTSLFCKCGATIYFRYIYIYTLQNDATYTSEKYISLYTQDFM